MTIKILNLYAGIGGNRKLWSGDIEVTAVEIEPSIAKAYKHFFPKDKIIIADAHQYLLEHFSEFDFIWSSPPCQSHSRTNYFLNGKGINRFPDMKLYEEIIFLQYWFKGKFVVENVIGYYEPLIKPVIIGRHYIWSNFTIIHKDKEKSDIGSFHKTSPFVKKSDRKTQIERNCVEPELGLHIFNMAFKEPQTTLSKLQGEKE